MVVRVVFKFKHPHGIDRVRPRRLGGVAAPFAVRLDGVHAIGVGMTRPAAGIPDFMFFALFSTLGNLPDKPDPCRRAVFAQKIINEFLRVAMVKDQGMVCRESNPELYRSSSGAISSRLSKEQTT